MTKRNPRQARFRAELKRLLKRGVPPKTAMKKAWARVPKNPRRGGRRRASAKEVMARVPSSAIYRTLVRLGVAPAAAASAVAKDTRGNPRLYICPYKGCKEVFGTQEGLLAHIRQTHPFTRKNTHTLTRTKARRILHHGRAQGYRLTPSQRGLFGAVASGARLREYTNPPPIKVLANGRLVGLIGFRPTRGQKIGRNPSIDIRV